MGRSLLTILFLCFISFTNAHQDVYMSKTYDNLTVRINVGFGYEETNKLKILGELGQRYLDEVKYKGKVFLDFDHYYVGKCETDYFISCDNGSIKYAYDEIEFGWRDSVYVLDFEKFTWDSKTRYAPILFTPNRIVIRVVGSDLDYKSILKLLEYSIYNKKKIRKNQRKIRYEQNYCQWYLNTIDTIKISNIINEETSVSVKKILNSKVYVADSLWGFGTSYYYKTDSFHFEIHSLNGIPDTVVLSIKDIFQVVKIGTGYNLVFDTDSSFYYVGRYGDQVISKKHYIKNTKNKYKPFVVRDIGDNFLTIYFNRFVSQDEIEKGIEDLYFEQTSLYDIKNDKLVSDIRRDLLNKE